MAVASTSSVGVTGTSGDQTTLGDAYSNLGSDEFLKLLVTELSNQDPTNPTDTSQLLSQLSQIRDIQSTDKLTETLESVVLGQSIATGASLIGRTIEGLDAEADSVNGVVDSVSVVDGVVTLHVGDQTVSLTNVAEILAADEESAAESEDMSAMLEAILNQLASTEET